VTVATGANDITAWRRRTVSVGAVGIGARLDVRATAVTLVLAAATVAAAALSISVGDFPIPLTDVLRWAAGSGTSDSDFIIGELRLPRTLTALLVGAAFGMSGAIFQSLARNALASPDVIGITAGASTAAVALIVWTSVGTATIAGGALVGGLVTAAAVYVLAYRRGVVGYRLVLVGIGVTAMLTAATAYLLTRAEIFEAQRATVWLTGSLNGRGWEHVRPLAVALAVLVPAAIALARPLRLLELGDDAARGLGVRVEQARCALVVVGVALAAVATASAGPVAFVALAAPQIALRLVRSGAPTLVPAAAVGCLVMLLSDLIARRVFAPTELPVGVVTGVVGGPYLLWLLARANRSAT
jgi:iron complex transport system permease protein